MVDISGPTTLLVISWPIMLIMLEVIPRFIISEDLYVVDIWLFLGIWNEDISRPIILLDMLRRSFPSSLSELESM